MLACNAQLVLDFAGNQFPAFETPAAKRLRHAREALAHAQWQRKHARGDQPAIDHWARQVEIRGQAAVSGINAAPPVPPSAQPPTGGKVPPSAQPPVDGGGKSPNWLMWAVLIVGYLYVRHKIRHLGDITAYADHISGGYGPRGRR